MPPYRQNHAPADASESSSSEEPILYGLLVLIGAIPVVIALVQRVALGVEATLGLMMVSAGAVGAIAHLVQARGRSAHGLGATLGHPGSAGPSGAGSNNR